MYVVCLLGMQHADRMVYLFVYSTEVGVLSKQCGQKPEYTYNHKVTTTTMHNESKR